MKVESSATRSLPPPPSEPSLEEQAQALLLASLDGVEVAEPPSAIKRMMVLLLTADDDRSAPPTSRYGILLASVSVSERAHAFLSQPWLDPMDLLGMVDVLAKTRANVLTSHMLTRAITLHPGASPEVLAHLVAVAWNDIGPERRSERINTCTFLERVSPYTRAALWSAFTLLSTDAMKVERLGLEIGALGMEGVELFTTLYEDKLEEKSADGLRTRLLLPHELREVVESARRLSDPQ